MKLTEPITVGTNKEGRKIYIKRPCSKFVSIASYREAFMAEARQGTECSHPNLLSYIGLQKDEEGMFIALEYVPALTLNKALLDAVLHINSGSESKRIMNQLMDVVGYLHSRNICHLNIRPENIYITKSSHDVRLANPGNTYANCTPSFFIYKEQFTAPELFEENNVPTPACDIYSLGKVMEYLYSYSHLSYGIRRIIDKATQADPAKRYASIKEMQEAFNRSRLIDRGIQIMKGAAVICVITLAYYGLRDEPVSSETLQFIEDTTFRNRQAQIESSQSGESNIGMSYSVLPIPSDTLRQSPTGNDTLSIDAEEHQRLAEQIFKKEFRKRAEAIITGMYTPQRMNVTGNVFQKQNMDGFSQLNKIQKELAEQFNMDPILTTRLSSEIISELTTESMKKLREIGDKD
jgi:serine/threonine protein kinase